MFPRQDFPQQFPDSSRLPWFSKCLFQVVFQVVTLIVSTGRNCESVTQLNIPRRCLYFTVKWRHRRGMFNFHTRRAFQPMAASVFLPVRWPRYLTGGSLLLACAVHVRLHSPWQRRFVPRRRDLHRILLLGCGQAAGGLIPLASLALTVTNSSSRGGVFWWQAQGASHHLKKVKAVYIALHGKPISELRGVTCLMESPSVTCRFGSLDTRERAPP